MRVLIFIFFTLVHVTSFSQVLERMEELTKGLDNALAPKIILFNETPSAVQFDSIAIASKYLDSLRLEKRILGFNVTGLNMTNDSIIFSQKVTGHVFPESLKEKINNCGACSNIKIDHVTIRWFTGTYGIRASGIWRKIK